jgi:hypothetical protein
MSRFRPGRVAARTGVNAAAVREAGTRVRVVRTQEHALYIIHCIYIYRIPLYTARGMYITI